MKKIFVALCGFVAGLKLESNVIIMARDPECSEGRSVTAAFQDAHILNTEDVAVFAARVVSSASSMPHVGGRRLEAEDFEVPLKAVPADLRRVMMPRAVEATVQLARNFTLASELRFYQGLELAALRTDLDPTDELALKVAAMAPCMKFVEPNMILDLHAEDRSNWLSQKEYKFGNVEDMTDEYIGELWHFDSYPGANVRAAWNDVRALKKPLVVGIVDTGCSAHPDLVDNLCLLERPNDVNCTGYDFGDDDVNPHDEVLSSVHGTPVSGIIAATGHNGFGLAGVCWDCKIMCLKMMDADGRASTSSVIEAYEYMYQRRVRLSNHSYGAYVGLSLAMEQGLQALEEIGHLFIASAGNSHCDLDHPENSEICSKALTPGGSPLPNILTVGSTTSTGTLSSFSNWGAETVHLLAPGEQILSLQNSLAAEDDSYYKYASGTSFSAPLVTGAAALLWSIHPEKTNLEIKAALMEGARVESHLKGTCQAGGVLDVQRSLDLLGGGKEGGFSALHAVPIPTVDRTNQFYGLPTEGIRGSFLPGGAYELPLLSVLLFALLPY